MIELATHEPILFKEESLTLHSFLFDKGLKKLVFEIFHLNNKKVQGKSSLGLELNGVPTYKIIQIHEAMGEYLNMSIDEMENENLTLKERIKELENVLIPPPILSNPITKMKPWKSSNGTPKSSSILRGTLSLLVDVIK
jgi:hypothetical protein